MMRFPPARPRVVSPALCAAFLLAASAATAPLAAAAGRWTAIGPEGGTVYALAFSPADPHHVYAGLSGGGVFHSVDGGRSWSSPSGGIAGLTVISLAADPLNPTVAYAGTSDGVWKTATAGAQWTAFRSHLGGKAIVGIAVDPASRQTVYAETMTTVYRSDNGGRQWTAVLTKDASTGLLTNLLLAAPDRLFAVFERYDHHADVLLSRDRGATWTRLDGLSNIDQVSGFTVDRASQTLYLAATPEGGQSGFRSLWKSADGGATWSSSAFPQPLSGNSVFFAVSATGRLYAGLDGVFASDDQGESWTEIGALAGGGERQVFGFPLALAADPADPQRVLAGTQDRGIFASTGGAWSARNSGLTATAVVGLTVDPSPRRRSLHVAVPTLGVFASSDSGVHWTAQNDGLDSPLIPGALLVNSLEADPQRAQRLVAGVFGGVARSEDDGRHWSFQAVNSCVDVSILAVAPGGRTLYGGGAGSSSSECTHSCFAYVSRDAGATWSCIPGFVYGNAAVADPINPNVGYVASDDVGLQATRDGGAHFAHSDHGLDARLVRALAISPSARRTVYAGTETGVWKSTDAGAHWVREGNVGLPEGFVLSLAVDPADARILYAGIQERGVFRSADGGATWMPLNDGLPARAFFGVLRLDPARRTLYVGTSGSGVWALPLR